jgi:hypothetical protein
MSEDMLHVNMPQEIVDQIVKKITDTEHILQKETINKINNINIESVLKPLDLDMITEQKLNHLVYKSGYIKKDPLHKLLTYIHKETEKIKNRIIEAVNAE